MYRDPLFLFRCNLCAFWGDKKICGNVKSSFCFGQKTAHDSYCPDFKPNFDLEESMFRVLPYLQLTYPGHNILKGRPRGSDPSLNDANTGNEKMKATGSIMTTIKVSIEMSAEEANNLLYNMQQSFRIGCRGEREGLVISNAIRHAIGYPEVPNGE